MCPTNIFLAEQEKTLKEYISQQTEMTYSAAVIYYASIKHHYIHFRHFCAFLKVIISLIHCYTKEAKLLQNHLST